MRSEGRNMPKPLERMNLIAICLLGAALGSVVVAQIRPAVSQRNDSGAALKDEWRWPDTLQVYPSHPDDPVKLVKITKGRSELVPGLYKMPLIAGTSTEDMGAVGEWLERDVSITLKSQTSKAIVTVGISVIFPARDTGIDCFYGDKGGPMSEAWCGSHPNWCDGGCPEFVTDMLHWGLIPAGTLSGLEARFARWRAERNDVGWPYVLQGEGTLRIAPGQEVVLAPAPFSPSYPRWVPGPGRTMVVSTAGRANVSIGGGDPRDTSGGLIRMLNGILRNEGIDEAKGEAPCDDRANSVTGCAFAKVPKFNIAVDIVYFEDGTVWGNYGYGHATPNPDGIFTRVDPLDSPGAGSDGHR